MLGIENDFQLYDWTPAQLERHMKHVLSVRLSCLSACLSLRLSKKKKKKKWPLFMDIAQLLQGYRTTMTKSPGVSDTHLIDVGGMKG